MIAFVMTLLACRLLRNCGLEQFAGVDIDQGKPQSGSTVTEPAEDACALVVVVGIGPGVAIDEVAVQGAVDQDGELAGGRGDGLRFADARGQAPIEGAEGGLGSPEAQSSVKGDRRRP